jgi:hypothetical protein
MVMKESCLWVSPHGNELDIFALLDRSHTTYGSTNYHHGILTDKIIALQVVKKFPSIYVT